MPQGPAVNFNEPPPGYETPEWPALYLPWREPNDLFYPSSIWRFTVYWTFVLQGVIFGISGAYAALVFGRRHKRGVVWAVGLPFLIVVFQGVIAFLAATIVGFALAAIYSAAYLRMSTWIPFLWAFAQTLVVVASSYSTVNVLL